VSTYEHYVYAADPRQADELAGHYQAAGFLVDVPHGDDGLVMIFTAYDHDAIRPRSSASLPSTVPTTTGAACTWGPCGGWRDPPSAP
jgi:hypothetical protein